MSEENNNNLPVIHSAENLTIIFPRQNQHLTEKEANKTRDLIKHQGAYTNDGQAYVDKNTLPHLLATDQKGANRFYNDLNDDDKLELGEQHLASVSALNKEISKRLQEPRDTLQRERLRDSEGCINALRDAPELEKIREVEESRIRKEQPKLKNKKIKTENIVSCQLSQQPLETNADAHHITRRADEPRKACDLENLVVVNKDVHIEIHSNGAESPEELSELCERKGWYNPIGS